MYLNDRKLKKMEEEASVANSERGYTLVEVLVTMVILSMILLVINMVLITMIRVSYNTDVRIKMRQGVEFAFEVMRRNVKSTDPGNLQKKEVSDGVGIAEAVTFRLSGGSGEQVVFYLEGNALGTDNNALTAVWSGDVVSRTGPLAYQNAYRPDRAGGTGLYGW